MLFYWNSCKIIIMKVIKHLVSIFLQLLTTLKGVHNIFVTGLEFLPDSPLVNDQLHNEFALLSISADNACKVTTLKRRSKLVLLHNSTSTVFYSEKFFQKKTCVFIVSKNSVILSVVCVPFLSLQLCFTPYF